MSGAIVIGAGPGIGASVTQRLARGGLPVAVLARSQTTVDETLASLAGIATQTLGVTADAFGELTARQHLDAWAVNVVGAITAVAHVGPRMAQADRGTILITGGMPQPVPEVTSLSLGTAGVRALTELLAGEYEPAGVHVATITVGGAIAPRTAFDPDDIAEHYWRLHTQPADAWQHEVVYTGRGASQPSPQSSRPRTGALERCSRDLGRQRSCDPLARDVDTLASDRRLRLGSCASGVTQGR